MALAPDITIHTRLENGTPVCIRPIREDDGERMRVGIGKMSPRSRYLRFFSGAASPPDWVIERLTEVDGHDHIAWGAIDTSAPDKPAIGAVHAFREADDPDSAEFSVGVLDEFHGQGLGKLLTATILLHARGEGLDAFSVNILGDNASARAFARALGARYERIESGVMEFALDVEEAIAQLRAECDPPGMADVFAAFADQPSGNGSDASKP
ncbi:GNAT family N-acetyltransferase [Qipengyuania sphaerica]|uniref:GNAT family N-acetyltransferase n=1 Tax=Qipengyuania sphaerica TaxID=2867243 RepID=UPI001C8804ED|nr:GNAT family N-acetyltransferase [Qipengyuania sphaerica]MBX7541768.1 GNAT family N-acetyltransferase [Qipengyuania sphaerica]